MKKIVATGKPYVSGFCQAGNHYLCRVECACPECRHQGLTAPS